MGLTTSFLIWIYIKRANLDYNIEGKCFSTEGVVYHEQTKDMYGILVLLGLLLTVICMIKLIHK